MADSRTLNAADVRNDDDDDSNPFNESSSMKRDPSPSPPAREKSTLSIKLNPTNYLKKLSPFASTGTACHGEDKVTAEPPPVIRGRSAWTSIVHVVLIDGRSLPVGTDSYFFVKFKLVNERYKTRYAQQATSITWQEQFNLYVYPPAADAADPTAATMLDISLRTHDLAARDTVVGQTLLDLSTLNKDETYDLEQRLDNTKSAVLRLLITVSDTRFIKAEQPTTEEQPEETRIDRDTAAKKYGLLRSLQNIRDIGWLEVKVLQARNLAAADLGGTSDPYCVLELINSRRQTHTEYKTLSPQWNRTFTLGITDIHAVLEVSVVDENSDKKIDFLGKVAIPLLKIYPGEKRWYQLKDATLLARAKGSIQLEMDLVFNNFKAAIRTFNPRTTQYTKVPAKFSVAVMRRNVARVSKIGQNAAEAGKVFVDCLEWKSKVRSTVALLLFAAGILLVEPYMLPSILVIVFIKNLVLISVTQESRPSGSDVDTDVDLEQDEDDKFEKKAGFMDKLQSVQDICLQVQEGMDQVASTCERVKNSLMWTIPWLSWLAVIGLTLLTVLFYFVPLRYIILCWGVIKFTKKLREPDGVHHIGIIDYLCRAPSDRQIVQYRELKPDAAGTDRKKKQT